MPQNKKVKKKLYIFGNYLNKFIITIYIVNYENAYVVYIDFGICPLLTPFKQLSSPK
jgi:hypothetical protein